jgi:hypothetical protein
MLSVRGQPSFLAAGGTGRARLHRIRGYGPPARSLTSPSPAPLRGRPTSLRWPFIKPLTYPRPKLYVRSSTHHRTVSHRGWRTGANHVKAGWREAKPAARGGKGWTEVMHRRTCCCPTIRFRNGAQVDNLIRIDSNEVKGAGGTIGCPQGSWLPSQRHSCQTLSVRSGIPGQVVRSGSLRDWGSDHLQAQPELFMRARREGCGLSEAGLRALGHQGCRHLRDLRYGGSPVHANRAGGT